MGDISVPMEEEGEGEVEVDQFMDEDIESSMKDRKWMTTTPDSVQRLIEKWMEMKTVLERGRVRNVRGVMELLIRFTACTIYHSGYTKIEPSLKEGLRQAVDFVEGLTEAGVARACSGLKVVAVGAWTYDAFKAFMAPQNHQDLGKETINAIWETEGRLLLESRLEMMGRNPGVFKNHSSPVVKIILRTLHLLLCKGLEFHPNLDMVVDGLPESDFFNLSMKDYLEYSETLLLLQKGLPQAQNPNTFEPLCPTFVRNVVVDMKQKFTARTMDERLIHCLWTQGLDQQNNKWEELIWYFLDLIVPKLMSQSCSLHEHECHTSEIKCFELWLEYFIQKSASDDQIEELKDALHRKFFTDQCANITNSECVYSIAESVFHKLCTAEDISRRDLYLDVMITGITKDLNLREIYKGEKEKDKLREVIDRLSAIFYKLAMADFMVLGHPKLSYKLKLTAFSLKPTKQLFDEIFNEASPVAELNTPDAFPISDNLLKDLRDLRDTASWSALSEEELADKSREELKELCRKSLTEGNGLLVEEQALKYARPTDNDYEEYSKQNLKPQYDPDEKGIEEGFRWKSKAIPNYLKAKGKSGMFSKASKLKYRNLKQLKRVGSVGPRRNGALFLCQTGPRGVRGTNNLGFMVRHPARGYGRTQSLPSTSSQRNFTNNLLNNTPESEELVAAQKLQNIKQYKNYCKSLESSFKTAERKTRINCIQRERFLEHPQTLAAQLLSQWIPDPRPIKVSTSRKPPHRIPPTGYAPARSRTPFAVNAERSTVQYDMDLRFDMAKFKQIRRDSWKGGSPYSTKVVQDCIPERAEGEWLKYLNAKGIDTSEGLKALDLIRTMEKCNVLIPKDVGKTFAELASEYFKRRKEFAEARVGDQLNVSGTTAEELRNLCLQLKKCQTKKLVCQEGGNRLGMERSGPKRKADATTESNKKESYELGHCVDFSGGFGYTFHYIFKSKNIFPAAGPKSRKPKHEDETKRVMMKDAFERIKWNLKNQTYRLPKVVQEAQKERREQMIKEAAASVPKAPAIRLTAESKVPKREALLLQGRIVQVAGDMLNKLDNPVVSMLKGQRSFKSTRRGGDGSFRRISVASRDEGDVGTAVSEGSVTSGSNVPDSALRCAAEWLNSELHSKGPPAKRQKRTSSSITEGSDDKRPYKYYSDEVVYKAIACMVRGDNMRTAADEVGMNRSALCKRLITMKWRCRDTGDLVIPANALDNLDLTEEDIKEFYHTEDQDKPVLKKRKEGPSDDYITKALAEALFTSTPFSKLAETFRIKNGNYISNYFCNALKFIRKSAAHFNVAEQAPSENLALPKELQLEIAKELSLGLWADNKPAVASIAGFPVQELLYRINRLHDERRKRRRSKTKKRNRNSTILDSSNQNRNSKILGSDDLGRKSKTLDSEKRNLKSKISDFDDNFVQAFAETLFSSRHVSGNEGIAQRYKVRDNSLWVCRKKTMEFLNQSVERFMLVSDPVNQDLKLDDAEQYKVAKVLATICQQYDKNSLVESVEGISVQALLQIIKNSIDWQTKTNRKYSDEVLSEALSEALFSSKRFNDEKGIGMKSCGVKAHTLQSFAGRAMDLLKRSAEKFNLEIQMTLTSPRLSLDKDMQRKVAKELIVRKAELETKALVDSIQGIPVNFIFETVIFFDAERRCLRANKGGVIRIPQKNSTFPGRTLKSSHKKKHNDSTESSECRERHNNFKPLDDTAEEIEAPPTAEESDAGVGTDASESTESRISTSESESTKKKAVVNMLKVPNPLSVPRDILDETTGKFVTSGELEAIKWKERRKSMMIEVNHTQAQPTVAKESEIIPVTVTQTPPCQIPEQKKPPEEATPSSSQIQVKDSKEDSMEALESQVTKPAKSSFPYVRLKRLTEDELELLTRSHSSSSSSSSSSESSQPEESSENINPNPITVTPPLSSTESGTTSTPTKQSERLNKKPRLDFSSGTPMKIIETEKPLLTVK